MAEGRKDKSEIRKILDELATRRSKKIITTSVRSGRRADVIVIGKRGHYVRHRKPQDEAVKDVAILPTIEAAIMRGGRDFRIQRQDFREKVRRKKISTLLAIVFDGSSSMVKDDKIGSIKDILQEILLDAYQKRDRVSLTVFNGQEATIIMRFTTSVESVKRFIEGMQYGGTTPLSSGILQGLELLEMKMLSEPESIPLLIVITDGSTNVPIVPGADIHRELMETCSQVNESAVNAVVIDVARGGSPLAKLVAEKAGARYFLVRSGTAEEERVDFVSHEIVKNAVSLMVVDSDVGNMLIRGATQEQVESVINDIDEMGIEVEVVDGCVFNCDPRKPEKFCPQCKIKYANQKAPFRLQHLNVIKVDESLTVDALKGGMDGDEYIPGIFARANRGILYIDGIDRLDQNVMRALNRTMIVKHNVLETDGEPIIHPASFSLIGRLSTPEADLRSPFYSNILMLVDVRTMNDIERRLRRIEQQKEFDIDSKKFRQNRKKLNKENLFRIIRARTLISQIRTTDTQHDVVSRACVEAAVSSNYMDVHIERLSRAICAFNHRVNLDMHDIIAACQYVLPLHTGRNATVARTLEAIGENIATMKGWVKSFE